MDREMTPPAAIKPSFSLLVARYLIAPSSPPVAPFLILARKPKNFSFRERLSGRVPHIRVIAILPTSGSTAFSITFSAMG